MGRLAGREEEGAGTKRRGEEQCREEEEDEETEVRGEVKGGFARDPCRAVLYPEEGPAPEKGNPRSDN